MRELRTAAVAVLALTVVLGLAYPLAMTGLAHALFPGRAGGSLVQLRGAVAGSTLIGQPFTRASGRTDRHGDPVLATDPRYFQSRPSVTGYAAAATTFDNQGPNQKALAARLDGYARAYLALERPFTPGLTRAAIPADAVTTSASGVDPDISEANARIQANRVARVRGLPLSRVRALIDDRAARPLFGLAGPGFVDVLPLNLALDREAPR